MSARISKIASSLKQIGDIQVAEWDFMGLLNTELNQLEVSRSLRRLGAIKVTDWDFSEVLPAIRETANIEVDLAGAFRRAARIKVMEWDFNSAGSANVAATNTPGGSKSARDGLRDRLLGFLRFVVSNLIDAPGNALVAVKEMGPHALCFQVVLEPRDVAMLIGREGHTAGAIRRILQAAGGRHDVQVLLHIQSHDEVAAAAKNAG